MKLRWTWCRIWLAAIVLMYGARGWANEEAEREAQLARQEQLRDVFLRTVDERNVYELVEALDNPLYRERAKATLIKIGPPSVSPLLERLEDRKTQNLIAVIETLEKLGPAASEAWPVLLKKTRVKDRELVAAVYAALLSNGSQIVPTLVAGLKDPDTEIRVQSARLLSQLGPLADRAVPALRATLQTKGESALVRFWTFVTLAEIGPPAEPTTPELLAALQQIEEKDRYLPARALGKIGPPARAAVPRLIRMIKERTSIQNTEAAAQALVDIGADAAPALAEMLRDNSKNRAPRELAAECLSHIGRPAVPTLLRMLNDRDLAVAERAAIVILQIGEPAVADMLALSKQTTDPELQFTLAQILARLPSAAHMAVPGLIVGLEDRDPARRLTSAQALSDTGPAALAALPALLQALRNDMEVVARQYGPDFANHYVQTVALAMTAAGEGAIVPLHRAMTDENPVVRTAAAQAMANLGMQYKSQVTPRMVGSLMVAHPPLQEMALATLAAIEPSAVSLARLGPKAIPGLAEAMRSGSPTLRDRAAQALVMIGPKSVTSLVECLVEPDLAVRLIAVRALAALKEKAEPATVALSKALRYKAEMAASPASEAENWREYSQSVALALGSIGPTAIPKLLDALQDEDPDIRLLAAGGLSHMGKAATPAVPGLRECLRHEKIEVRVAAVSTLNRIGPGAIDAAPDLLSLLRGIESSFRGVERAEGLRKGYARLLAETLGKLGPGVAPLLLPLVQDPDENTRVMACYALWKTEFKTADVAKIAVDLQPQLNAALADKNLAVRIVAARAIASLELTAADSIPHLLAAVRSSGEVMNDERFQDNLLDEYLPALVDALDSIGEPAIEPLVEMAKEQDEAVRGVAAWALFRVAPDASRLVTLGEGAIPVLISSLLRDDNEFSSRAARALVKFGDPAVKPLLQAYKEHGSIDGQGVAKTLAMMHESSALALVDALSDTDPVIRAAAARALGGVKPADPKSIPVSTAIDALKAALEDEDPTVQANARHSLFWLDERLAASLGIENPAKTASWEARRASTTLLLPPEETDSEQNGAGFNPDELEAKSAADAAFSPASRGSTGAPLFP